MTEEKLIEILTKDRDYLLPDEKGCNILFGLQIFAKYRPGKTTLEGAQHDEIYGPTLSDLISAGITEEDAIALWKRGWRTDDTNTGLHHFV